MQHNRNVNLPQVNVSRVNTALGNNTNGKPKASPD